MEWLLRARFLAGCEIGEIKIKVDENAAVIVVIFIHSPYKTKWYVQNISNFNLSILNTNAFNVVYQKITLAKVTTFNWKLYTLDYFIRKWKLLK